MRWEWEAGGSGDQTGREGRAWACAGHVQVAGWTGSCRTDGFDRRRACSDARFPEVTRALGVKRHVGGGGAGLPLPGTSVVMQAALAVGGPGRWRRGRWPPAACCLGGLAGLATGQGWAAVERQGRHLSAVRTDLPSEGRRGSPCHPLSSRPRLPGIRDLQAENTQLY